MKSSLTLIFSNIGNLSGETRLTFTPGFNELRGKRGIGKTNVMEAAVVATSGTGRLNARLETLPDGSTEPVPAYVAEEGVGILARGGERKKKSDTFSSPSIQIAPPEALTTFLTGNNMKDEEAADEARVRALFQLLPEASVTTEKDVKILSGGLAKDLGLDVETLLALPVLAVKDRIKAAANAAGLKAENLSKTKDGEANAYKTQLAKAEAPVEPNPMLSGDVSALTLAERTASAFAATQKLKAEQRVELEALKAGMGERPSAQAAEAEVKSIAADITLQTSVRTDAAATVQRLKEELQRAEARLTDIDTMLKSASTLLDIRQKELDAVLKSQTTYDAQLERFATLTTLPTPAEATLAQEAWEVCKTQLDDAKAYDAAKKRVEDANATNASLKAQWTAAVADREQAVRDGKKWRSVAEDAESNLAEVLRGKGIPAGITVAKGRVYASVDGKTDLFAGPTGTPHLSEGQQVGVLLDLAIAAYPGRVVSMLPSWYSALAEEDAKVYSDKARDAGIIVLTARPTSDDVLSVRNLSE